MSEVVTVRRGGLELPVEVSGPDDGPLVVLLHGFPQTPTCWAGVVPGLVADGFRVAAPAQRGYAASARPASERAYRLDELVGDVVAVADALGHDRFSVVGHDWGGVVAWALAAAEPERVDHLAVLATPHPAALVRSLARSTQGLRSSYALFFRLPVLSERLLSVGGGHLLAAALRRSGLPEEWVDRYRPVFGSVAPLRAALRWYRATGRRRLAAVEDVTVPTLYVWADGDTALGPAAAEATGDHVTGPYAFVRLRGTSHWIPETAPGDVVGLLVEHLAAARAA